jgi:superkiller protein 3
MSQTWESNPTYDRGVELLFSDPAGALEAFDEALTHQPARPRLHANRGWALHRLGRPDEALEAAEHARSLDATDGYIATRLVHFHFDAGDYEEVVPLAQEALRLGLDPDDEHYARTAIGWALMQFAPVAAVEQTREVAGMYPEDGEALAVHGCALAGVCRWDEALQWMDRAIEAGDDPRYVDRRGAIAVARDQGISLLEERRAATWARPDDASAFRQLGLACARLVRHEEALEAFERARELEPEADPDADLEVAHALMVEATLRPDHRMLGPVG